MKPAGIGRALVAALFAGGLATAAGAQGPEPSAACAGDTVLVRRGDTVSRIAERCGIGEARLLRANPRVEGSDDLAVGEALNLPPGDVSALDAAGRRLRSLASRAGDRLSGLAAEIGSPVEDLLDKNPDLRQRLRTLGDRLGVPGVDADAATVTLSPQVGPPGTSVTLSAIGLPPNAAVAIGAGAPGRAYEVLDRARTSVDGTLRATVRAPEGVDGAERLVFTVAGDGWKARSPAFALAPGLKL